MDLSSLLVSSAIHLKSRVCFNPELVLQRPELVLQIQESNCVCKQTSGVVLTDSVNRTDEKHPAQALSLFPRYTGGGGGLFTNHSVVEVIGQHPLTHGNQQPEGFLLLGVQQQHGGQDVHGLLGSQGGQLLTSPRDATEMLPASKPKQPTKVKIS